MNSRKSRTQVFFDIRWLIAAMLIFSAMRSIAQNPPSLPDGEFATSIPFKLINGHIYLEAKINDKPVVLVLDSGAGSNVLTPAAAKEITLSSTADGFKARGAGEELVPVSRGSAQELKIGNATIPTPQFYVIPLPEALECQGLLGFDLFNQFVVRIDYARYILTLIRPGQFRPTAKVPEYNLILRNNLPYVDGELDGIKGRLELDTGANDSLTVFNAFTERHKLRTRYQKSVEAIDGKGVGGYVRSQVVRMPNIKIGDFIIPNVLASLSRNMQGVFAQDGPAGNIGSGILSRFTVTFDYRHRKLYLEPNSYFGKSEIFNRSGAAIDHVDGKWVVIDIVQDGPAAEAGLKIGDEIIRLDGKANKEITFRLISEKARQELGTDVKITVQNAAGKRDVVVKLRDII